jgi:hypothetical protein
MKIHPVRAELFHADRQTHRQPDRQTDMTKLLVVFHNLTNGLIWTSNSTTLTCTGEILNFILKFLGYYKMLPFTTEQRWSQLLVLSHLSNANITLMLGHVLILELCIKKPLQISGKLSNLSTRM